MRKYRNAFTTEVSVGIYNCEWFATGEVIYLVHFGGRSERQAVLNLFETSPQFVAPKR